MPIHRRAMATLSLAFLLNVVATATGCSDTGDDNSNHGPTPAPDAAVDASRVDGALPSMDSTVPMVADTGVDSGADRNVDASASDAASADVAARDAVTDSLLLTDSLVLDAAATDTGARDAGLGEASAIDAARESGAVDASLPDAAALKELQLAVVRQYNGDASAPTPTEQQFLNKDVANVLAGVPGESLDPVKGFTCANCLETNDCLNTAVDGVSGKECEDVVGTAAAASRAGTARSALCEALLSCMFSTASTCVATGVSQACFCGATPLGQCASLAQGTGTCAQQEADALELAVTDSSNIIKGFGNSLVGGGQANDIFGCAKANGCNTCWQ